MIINVADAKSKFSSLLSIANRGKEEVIISKRDKPVAVLISYEDFLKMKKDADRDLHRTNIDTLPSALERFKGSLSESEIDPSYKESRASYLQEKYQ